MCALLSLSNCNKLFYVTSAALRYKASTLTLLFTVQYPYLEQNSPMNFHIWERITSSVPNMNVCYGMFLQVNVFKKII